MPAKHPPQTYGEMIESGKQTKKTRIYKAESSDFVDGQISQLVGKIGDELQEVAIHDPISLNDTDRVKQQTLLYLRACETASCLPSINGLARALGCTRQALYDCIWRGSPASTAQWLEVCRDSFSDALSEASLRNNCNSIVSIFLQKALYGLRESVEIVAKTETALGPEIDQAALEQRILESIPDDEYDC